MKIATAIVLVVLGLLITVDFADFTMGMLILLGFTFNPAWIKPSQATGKAIVFYDGQCGLCHGFVRFLLAKDGTGQHFEFSPLEGKLFVTILPESRRGNLPDSLVVRTAEGGLLVRSAAVRHVLARLGGIWRVAAILTGIVPQGLLDLCYDGIARIRSRLFRRPADSCPLVPPDLRQRFHP